MITLSSDFGTPYPASMKGVILQHADARLVDVAHDFPRQDVHAAAFWLREVLPHFPPAVHLAVVDPGVGTDRKAVVVRAGEHAIVAPDNGVAMPAARALADAATGAADAGDEGDREDPPDVEVFEIRVEDPASSTFHGRDVFAPAAADVHERGVRVLHEHDRYAPVSDPVELSFPEPSLASDVARGKVLVVDGFGNAVTNLPGNLLADRFGEYVEVNGDRVPVEHTYAAVNPDERLVTVGSHGNVELAANRGRGDEAFGVTSRSQVELTW
ncbi:SAM hydrolase/SAM-dependent halogenase family protein [Halobacterium zhouii]|uniref:SAM hydrolase/SAM-dependent halogenase family protein n=1 Tax=Halobacterium zhouii TaxID=2902624 RepID=UPI001E5B7CA1|nr:SAM-dependent chlorinase/fluorinase [Halobacterium zhouii]